MVRFTRKQERLNVAMNPEQGLKSGSSFKTVAVRGSHRKRASAKIGSHKKNKKGSSGKLGSSLDALAFGGDSDSGGDDDSSSAVTSSSSSSAASSSSSAASSVAAPVHRRPAPRRVPIHHPPANSSGSDSDSDDDDDGGSVMTSVSGNSDASLGAYAAKKRPGGSRNLFGAMSKEEAEAAEKNDLLAHLHVLRQRDVHLSKNFTAKSGLAEMRLEMGRIEHEASMGKAIKINRRWFLAGAATLSKATDNFGPNITRGRWHGFDKHLLAQIEDFNDPFERLSEHYGGVVGAVTGGNPLWEIGVLFVYQFLMYGLASTGGEKARASEGLSIDEVREKFPHVIQEAVKLELARQRQEDEAKLRQAQLDERARAEVFDAQQAAFHAQMHQAQQQQQQQQRPLLPPQFDPRVLTGRMPPQEEEQGVLHQPMPGHITTPPQAPPVLPAVEEPFQADEEHEQILLQAGGIGLGSAVDTTMHDDTFDDFLEEEDEGLAGDVGELAYTLATRTGDGRPDIPPNKRDLAHGGVTIDVN